MDKEFEVQFSIKSKLIVPTDTAEKAAEIINTILQREKWHMEDVLCAKVDGIFVDDVVELVLV